MGGSEGRQSIVVQLNPADSFPPSLPPSASLTFPLSVFSRLRGKDEQEECLMFPLMPQQNELSPPPGNAGK